MIRQFHRNESSWNVRSRGTKVPRERMFHGTKVLGTFAPEERKFHRSDSSKERMFHGSKVPRERKFSLWSFRSLERKCRGTKRPGGLVICELRTGEPVICELTCELGRWLDVTSHACHVRFAKYRTGFAVRIVSSAGLTNLIAALLKGVAFVYLWLLFFWQLFVSVT